MKYCTLSSSADFYILFLSESTGPIGTKLGRNVHLIVLLEVYGFFFVDRKCTKETRGPRVSRGAQALPMFQSLLLSLGQSINHDNALLLVVTSKATCFKPTR